MDFFLLHLYTPTYIYISFERESFVPVCTSKNSKKQSVSVFARPLYSELSQFLRYHHIESALRDAAQKLKLC